MLVVKFIRDRPLEKLIKTSQAFLQNTHFCDLIAHTNVVELCKISTGGVFLKKS